MLQTCEEKQYHVISIDITVNGITINGQLEFLLGGVRQVQRQVRDLLDAVVHLGGKIYTVCPISLDSILTI